MALIIVLLLMAALISVTTMTMLSSLTTVTSSGDERSRRIATYAAESGVSVGTEYLFAHCDPASHFTALLNTAPAGILGNTALPGTPANPFTAAMQAWYTVSISNNWDDPSGSTTSDSDSTVFLTSLGHGPDNTTVEIKVEIHDPACGTGGNAFGYGQGGANASNSGTTTSGTVSNVGMTTLNASSL